MNFLDNLIPQEVIEALGWTLLHSIWQTALIALLLGILMLIIQGSSKIRYVVAASTLPMVLCAAMITFFITYQSVKTSSFNKATNAIESSVNQFDADAGPGISTTEVEKQDSGLTAQFESYFTSHFPLIVTLWFLGIIVLTLKFLGGMAYLQRLKRYKTVDITHQWEEKLTALGDKIGLKKTVRLLESSLVSVPMVIGYIKPVILLPLGAISGLSTTQLEAVLAHELAHIYRKDYLINILQTSIEILFFYHPAIWWISSRVREERENCCDDIAVQLNENSIVYAKALTTLGEMHSHVPSFAMAATGKSGMLFKRIQRILTPSKQNPTFTEGFITACILVVGVFSLSLVARANFTGPEKENHFSNSSMVNTMNEGDFTATVHNLEDSMGKNNNLVIIKNKKGKIVELYVNGKKIPKRDLKEFEPMIKQSLANENKQRNDENLSEEQREEIIEEMLSEVETAELPERPEHPKHPEKVKHPKPVMHPRLGPENSEVFKEFTRKTVEISQMGVKMGALSMKMEGLQKKLAAPNVDNSKNSAEVKALEKEISQLERKIEKLGKEIEVLGEEFGQLTLEMTSSALKNIDFDDHYDGDRGHHDDHDEDDEDFYTGGDYVCPPCESDCHDGSFDKPGQCPKCMMELIKKK